MQQDELRALAILQMDAVYRLSYQLPDQPRDADDLVVETFRTALTSNDDPKRTEQGVRIWLFTILYNAARQRNQAGPPPRSAPVAEVAAPAVPGSSTHWPVADLSAVDWDHADERIGRTIRDLSFPHRAAFLLCMVENLKYRDAAQVMGVPAGEVITLLHESRALLSAQLAGPAPAGPDEGDFPHS